MGGQDLGTQHDVATQLAAAEGAKPALIQAVSTVNLSVKRLGMKVDLRFVTTFVEDSTGAVRSLKYREIGNTGNRAVSGSVEGGKLLLTVETAGRAERKELPWDPDTVGLYAQNMRLKCAKITEGQVIKFKSFMPELLRTVAVTVTVGKMETVDVAGKPMELRKAEVTMDVLPGMITSSWLDEKGDIIKSYVALAGGLEQIRVDAATAKKVAAGAELLSNYLISTNCRISEPETVTDVLYKITAPENALNQIRWVTRRQSVLEQKGDALVLRVKSEWPRRAAAQALLTSEQLAPYLAPTQYLQSDDPAIRQVARQVAGKGGGVLPTAKKLEQWVYDNVTAKDFRMAFSTASEVLKNREGDCTEHAVLLAALCRAAGIPSRVTCGLVYWQGVFGYHMWTEVYDAGWVALDATMPHDYVDATHISLGSSALDATGLADMSLGIIQIIGSMKIDVLEYATAKGKIVAVAPPTLAK